MKTAREWQDALDALGFKTTTDGHDGGIIDLCTAAGEYTGLHLEIRQGGTHAVLVEADEDGQCGELSDEETSLDAILEAIEEHWPAEEDE